MSDIKNYRHLNDFRFFKNLFKREPIPQVIEADVYFGKLCLTWKIYDEMGLVMCDVNQDVNHRK